MRAQDFADLYALEEGFWWFVGMRGVTAALLDPFCPPGAARRVLDAGCGTGVNLEWLRRYGGGAEVFGVDVEQTALDFCRGRGRRALARASVTELPFEDESFDLVTSFDVLVQLPGEGADERAMREMFRVLRPGGLAFVRAAAYEWMKSGHDAALQTQRRYGLGELRRRLERAGLRTLRATYANSLLLPVAAVRRLLLKPVGLADRGSDVRPLPAGMDWLNRALTRVLLNEARLLARPGARLPAGLSAICVVEKPRRD
jgi:SAM-dependent methyltransferase